MQFQDWMFDRRVIDRNIRKGLIKRADVAKYLKSLPDMSDKAAPLYEETEETPADESSESKEE